MNVINVVCMEITHSYSKLLPWGEGGFIFTLLLPFPQGGGRDQSHG